LIKNKIMEENKKILESLLEKATEYGKTSFELAKLKTLDKTSNVVSSYFSNYLVFVIIVLFMVFLGLGFALWLNEILCKIYLGFFIVSAFYIITAAMIHFFMHKRLKNLINDYIIKEALK